MERGILCLEYLAEQDLEKECELIKGLPLYYVIVISKSVCDGTPTWPHLIMVAYRIGYKLLSNKEEVLYELCEEVCLDSENDWSSFSKKGLEFLDSVESEFLSFRYIEKKVNIMTKGIVSDLYKSIEDSFEVVNMG